MLEGYEKPFNPDVKITEIYIDLDVVNDQETVDWVISEAKRCYGEDVTINTFHGNEKRPR